MMSDVYKTGPYTLNQSHISWPKKVINRTLPCTSHQLIPYSALNRITQQQKEPATAHSHHPTADHPGGASCCQIFKGFSFDKMF